MKKEIVGLILLVFVSSFVFACSLADDNPIDGVVSINELISYISQWKLGDVNIGELITAISEWKSGCTACIPTTEICTGGVDEDCDSDIDCDDSDCSVNPGCIGFLKRFGTPDINLGWEEGFGMTQSGDGGVVITGYTTSYGTRGTGTLASYHDLLILKVNSLGEQVWARTLGGYNCFDIGNEIKRTSNGGYIVAGVTSCFGAGGQDMLISKFTSAGTIEWIKTIGGSGNEAGVFVDETSDGGYVIIGSTDSYGAGDKDIMIAKFTSTGNLDWVKTLGGPGEETGTSVLAESTGNIILTGSTDEGGPTARDGIITKLNSLGTPIWTKSLGGPEDERINDIALTADGGYITSGVNANSTRGFDIGDWHLARWTSNGNLIWSKTYGGPGIEAGSIIVPTIDNNYALGSWSSSWGISLESGNDIILWKVNPDGNILWAKSTGYPISDETRMKDMTKGFVQVADGSYFITGETVNAYVFDGYGADIPLVKYTEDGNTCRVTDVSPIVIKNVLSEWTLSSPVFLVSSPPFTENIPSVIETTPVLAETDVC